MYKLRLRSLSIKIIIFIFFSFLLYHFQFNLTARDKFFKYEYQNPYKDPKLLLNPHITKSYSRVNACIVVLARNDELHQLRFSMRQFEDRWNKKYNYPYVFLNDEEFTEEFKKYTSAMTQSKTKYGKF